MAERYKRFQQKLTERAQVNRLRKLQTWCSHHQSGMLENNFQDDTLLNMCSNDYLGLSVHPDVIQQGCQYLQKYGAGARSSRLISGNLLCHDELEEKLARFFNVESCLVFNTGFQGNISIIHALADRSTVIFIDKWAHNSLIQGARLSNATVFRYSHNDADHLHSLLKRHTDRQHKLIITESVFSMDGDRAPLNEISALAETNEALLLVDDAHAVGVFGEDGRGLAYSNNRIDFITGTFGKSFGALGGYVLCKRQMKEYFINFSSGFIYSTGIQPATAGSVLAALELIPVLETERSQILENATYLRSSLQKMGFDTGVSDSQIVPVIIGSDEQALALSSYLFSKGFLVSAVRPPAVQEGKARLRFTITTSVTKEHVESLVDAIKVFKSMKVEA